MQRLIRPLYLMINLVGFQDLEDASKETGSESAVISQKSCLFTFLIDRSNEQLLETLHLDEVSYDFCVDLADYELHSVFTK